MVESHITTTNHAPLVTGQLNVVRGRTTLGGKLWARHGDLCRDQQNRGEQELRVLAELGKATRNRHFMGLVEVRLGVWADGISA